MQPTDPLHSNQAPVPLSGTGAAPQQNTVSPIPQQLQELAGSKNSTRKFKYIAIATALCAFCFIVGLSLLKNTYPKYEPAKQSQVDGFTVHVFDGWEKQTSDQSEQKTTTFSDYIDKSKKASSLVHAQQVVVTQADLIPADQLTDLVKKDFIEKFTNKNTFFEGLGGEVEQCSELQDKQVSSVNSFEDSGASVVIDFSFSCPASATLPGIRAVGRLVLANNGSLAVNFIAASEAVFSKNTQALTDAALSIRSK